MGSGNMAFTGRILNGNILRIMAVNIVEYYFHALAVSIICIYMTGPRTMDQYIQKMEEQGFNFQLIPGILLHAALMQLFKIFL